ncbi:MAG TPA: pyruvate kinase, partial [Candidatus Nanoarchaeia archaeon]|nr:pyruvate kinase [Candidatus Nanoarchaeia archaeon]
MVKIIATIGSSSIKTEILNKLKSHRVDFVRINLSHTKEEEIEETIELLKKSNLPIIIDTEGSKIRTRPFKGKPILLSEGETVKIFNKEILSEKDTSESKIIADNTNEIISIQPKEVLDFIQPGNLISIDFDSVLLNV